MKYPRINYPRLKYWGVRIYRDTGVSGPRPYIARVWGTSGVQSICELTFCAASCTTRHLVSFDMNKSYRPGFLVLVSYIAKMFV